MAKFLTLPDVEFVNLQYGETSDEREEFKEEFHKEIIDFNKYNLTNNFENLTALVESCDLIITISNITAHIAGAIGKKTWVIVPLSTLWHWFHKRSNSLWYPNVELFRQKQYGQWEDVINKLYNEVKLKS